MQNFLYVPWGQMHRCTALIYCWGDTAYHPLKTMLSYIETRKQGIAMSELNQVLKDVVIITRNLNIHYLVDRFTWYKSRLCRGLGCGSLEDGFHLSIGSFQYCGIIFQ